MQLDWSISIGNIISLAAFLVTLLTLHQSNKNTIRGAANAATSAAHEAAASMARIETKIDTLWNWWVQRDREQQH